MKQPLLFELSSAGRLGCSLPELDVPESRLPVDLLREELPLPELTEREVVQHFTRLSQLNFSVDTGFYPLGSCTMKYNPKVHEEVASYTGFTQIHPLQGQSTVQGALQLMFELQRYLAEITGLPAVSLQPVAGAHGELTGMLIIRAHHLTHGEAGRTTVLVPDSAHGTNPASAAMCGYRVATIPSDQRGNIDVNELDGLMDQSVAGIMLTNPNTLGLFEEHILQVAEIVHGRGGLIYCDGANMNALLGIAKPGELGADVLHLNLHKTFSTPHGGGGPGGGATAVTDELSAFLPTPVVACREPYRGNAEDAEYYLDFDRPQSIGPVSGFYGNFGVMVKAYTYLRSLGEGGLREVAENAVLNANYILHQLGGYYDLPYDRTCLHECVFSGKEQAKLGVHTLDIAKRLIDLGFHPPTVYFPLNVDEALMIEPTETESLETLDAFVAAMRQIAVEAEKDPETVLGAPRTTPVGRLDEVGAARKPNLRWHDGHSREK
jgi:glycine dehydrogenase subunit 2